MWLKRHYPAEFYTALISTIPKAKRTEKVPKVLRAVQASGIPLLPPDINLSTADFSTDGEVIRFGLLSIKGMGDGAANEIIEKRPFSSMEDVEERVAPRKCNSGNRKALLECGAFDTFGARADWSVDDCTRLEIEKLGFSLSRDVSTLIQTVRRLSHTPLEIEDMVQDEECVVGGEVVEVKQINTKRGELMAFVSLGIGQDTYRVTFFPPAFSRYGSMTQLGSWMMINGKKDDRGGIKATVACLVEELVQHVNEQELEQAIAS
jgi:DNA polymerase-3 subunit alpha